MTTEQSPLSVSDIGQTVYAVMAADPMTLCWLCGAPDNRCDHIEHWGRAEIPAIASGKLMSMEANRENVSVLYQIEGIGMNQPLSVHRTMEEARAEVRGQFSKELALITKWAEM